MSRWVLLVGLALGACEAVEPQGRVLDPARAGQETARLSGGTDAAAGDEGFDFDAYKREQAQVDGQSEVEEPEELLPELGAEGIEIPDDLGEEPTLPAAPEAPAALTPPVPPAVAAPPPMPPGPAINAVNLALGVRLVATLNDTTPPRAVLGLPSGEERVVRAGDMLPQVGLVVLAVGRDLVQVAQIEAQGDHARVESVFLQSLAPGRATDR